MARIERPLAVAATFGGLLLALGACRGVIGLDEFHNGECPGAVCKDDGGTILADANAPVDAAKDVAADAPPGASPVSWARFKMPNYGDSGLPNPPSYKTTGDTVTDDVTGLVWKNGTLPADLTETAAETACRGLAAGPWRLPKRIELVTLLDYSRSGVLIDPVAFPDVKNVTVWTSSDHRPVVADATRRYWTVSFGTGEVGLLDGTLVAKALCVKDKP